MSQMQWWWLVRVRLDVDKSPSNVEKEVSNEKMKGRFQWLGQNNVFVGRHNLWKTRVVVFLLVLQQMQMEERGVKLLRMEMFLVETKEEEEKKKERVRMLVRIELRVFPF